MNPETDQPASAIPAPKIEVKSIKHQFTPPEVVQLNVDFRGAFGTLDTIADWAWGGYAARPKVESGVCV